MALPATTPGAVGTLQNESFYEGLIRQQFGSAAASKYASLYGQLQKQFPPTTTESTAYQIFNPFFAALAAGAGVDSAAQAVSSATAGVGKIAATTSLNLPFSGVLSGLFQANIWLRVGEVVLGLVLIAVGIARLTTSVPAATKIAKSVGTVALA
jgi:hypothetical protein